MSGHAGVHAGGRVAGGAPATRLSVNGRPVEVRAPGGRHLLDVLRVDLGLTGTKEGCGEGECGACAVILDGRAVNACLVPLCQAAGREVLTVEGLAVDGRLDALQSAMLAAGGVQCGICTPGLLVTARAFLDARASGQPVTDAGIREAIAGNLCRCTGYVRVVDAIRLAADGRTSPMAAPAATRDGPGPGWVPVGGVDTTIAGATTDTAEGGAALDADPDAVSPSTLDDALALLAAGGLRPLAGGTDVLVERMARTATDAGYLDLSRLPDLRGIDLEDGALVLGAATTFGELRRSPLVADVAPVLATMAAHVGAAQVQERATIGGNIATASPAGDSLPVLLALDAAIVVLGPRGERTVPAASFFPAYRRTALAPDELIISVRVPRVDGRTAVFRKVARRRAQAISVVSIAVAWQVDEGRWHDVRVALGAVAPTPIRTRATERVLEGGTPGEALAGRAADALAGEIAPIDDVRSTAAYRRAGAGRILHRIVVDAARR